MKSTLRRLKRLALPVLAGSGAASALASTSWRRRRLAILCYHGFAVADERKWLPDYYVTAAHLRQRLTLLRDQGYTVLSLNEATTRLAAGTLPPRAAAITVDDGSADFHSVAAPIFEEFAVPATLYLTSFHCRTQTPIFRFSASYILWKGQRANAVLPVLGQGWNLLDADVREQAASLLQQHARQHGFDQQQRLELLGELASLLQVDHGRMRRLRLCQLITPEEGRDLVRRGFDLQIHTHRHRTPRQQEPFLSEIDENRRFLMEELGVPAAEHFCYPSGDYAPEFLPWLASRGIRTATTCENALASAASHPLLLPRLIDTMGLTQADFTCRLAGLMPSREQKTWFRVTGLRDATASPSPSGT